MQNTLWIYIWRFQPFHNGHRFVVETMLQDNTENLIVIGTPEVDKDKNPFSLEWRKEAIKSIFPTISITSLDDSPSDRKWVENLSKILIQYPVKKYIFYCWDKENDFAIQVIQRYTSLFLYPIEIKEISRKNIPISATLVREKIKWNKSIKEIVPEEIYKKIKPC